MRHLGSRTAVIVSLLGSACVGPHVQREVEETQTRLQQAIRQGSKSPRCAPRETAYAEAQVRFANDALAVGDLRRGKAYAALAATNATAAWEQVGRCSRDAAIASF